VLSKGVGWAKGVLSAQARASNVKSYLISLLLKTHGVRYQQIDEKPASCILAKILSTVSARSGMSPSGAACMGGRRKTGQEGQMRLSCTVADADGNGNSRSTQSGGNAI
jgi:hypothetical protein